MSAEPATKPLAAIERPKAIIHNIVDAQEQTLLRLERVMCVMRAAVGDLSDHTITTADKGAGDTWVMFLAVIDGLEQVHADLAAINDAAYKDPAAFSRGAA